jgi:Arc/MetJ-type ribon-helix-helix transcriptional regulator
MPQASPNASVQARTMKKPISATIDAELIKWIEKELQDRQKYRNKSHLIEIALSMLKNNKK